MDNHANVSILAGPGEIDSLYEWLRKDANLGRVAAVSGVAPRDSGTMSAVEIIDMVFTHLEAASSLALALAAWRQTRREPGVVTLRRADGQEMIIPSGSGTSAEMVRAFLSADTRELTEPTSSED